MSTFELNIEGLGGVVSRFTGGYLRQVNAEANRILAGSPDRSDDEVAAQIVEVARRHGIHQVDQQLVRQEVARARGRR